MINLFYDIIAIVREIQNDLSLLIFLVIWFFIARLIGKLTVQMNFVKIIFLFFIVIHLAPSISVARPVVVFLFFAGILSNHVDIIRGIFSWSQGVGDMIFAVRHRFAYAEIRRLEEENEALKAKLRAAQMQDGGQSSTQQQWKQQARSWRSKPDGNGASQSDGGRGGQGQSRGSSFSQGASSSSSRGSTASGSSGKQRGGYSSSSNSSNQGASSTQGQNNSRTQSKSSGQNRRRGTSGKSQGSSQSQSSAQSKPTFTLRDQHLQTLGLRPGQTYSAAEIKAAWRKRAKETHPDAGGSKAAFIAVVNAYNSLK